MIKPWTAIRLGENGSATSLAGKYEREQIARHAKLDRLGKR